jgi:methanogenic corrinoid protein MtbC1
MRVIVCHHQPGEFIMDIQHTLVEMIRQADRNGARALLDSWVEEHGHDRLLAEVLEPALLLIGEQWRCTEAFTLAQAYVAAKVAEDALLRIAQKRGAAEIPPPSKGAVVIGNIEEDFHSLGRRMLGIFLSADGWTVHDLGNDVLATEFVDKALEVGARVIGVSAMMLSTARNIRRLRDEIDRRGLTGRIQLAVGGAVFLVCPDLDVEVGGDGTARTAMESTKLFDHLWRESVSRDAAP